MTTEEKAKAYDEALEKAKKYHEEYWQVDAKDITETLFPQLIESKDESMMKNIRLALLSVEDAFWRTHGLTAKEAISYIEKQKDFAADEYWRGFKNGRDEVIENPNAFNLQEKQKEQKPTDKEQDSIAFLEQHGYTIVPPHAPVSIVPSSEATLTEWSEEDRNRLEEAIRMIEANGTWVRSDDGVKQVSDFLKSLPERFNLQPKQEWSEEDEKMIDTIVSVLGQYIDYKAVSGTGTGYATPRYSKEIDWLKSIRPRSSWKPSEEEMKALDVACSGKLWYGEIYLNGLRRIREQLKKL